MKRRPVRWRVRDMHNDFDVAFPAEIEGFLKGTQHIFRQVTTAHRLLHSNTLGNGFQILREIMDYEMRRRCLRFIFVEIAIANEGRTDPAVPFVSLETG